MANNLTPQMEAFCLRYIETGNASRSYEHAYGKGNRKDATQRRRASALLKKPKIAAYIAALRADRLAEHKVTVERVAQELSRIAFCDFRKLYDDDGELKKIVDLDTDTAAVVASVDQEDVFEGVGRERTQIGVLRKIKLCDKLGALTALGRHLGMFRDKLDVTMAKKIEEMTDEELAAYVREYEQSQGSVLPGDPGGKGTP